jgi:hypothetical protein
MTKLLSDWLRSNQAGGEHFWRPAGLANALEDPWPIIDTRIPGGVPWPAKDGAILYKPALPDRYRRIAEPLGIVGAIQIECSPLPEDIIALAGGEGVRLLLLVRQLCGMNGRNTLDRVGLQIPAVQTVIVTCRAHGKYMTEEFAEMRGQRILVQPEDRRTAAGVLFPAHWIYSQDPDAVVALFPVRSFDPQGKRVHEPHRDPGDDCPTAATRLVLVGGAGGRA